MSHLLIFSDQSIPRYSQDDWFVPIYRRRCLRAQTRVVGKPQPYVARLKGSNGTHASSQTTFEWDLHGLKDIFDSSRDEEKSPLIASAAFGGGKWQVSLYLRRTQVRAEFGSTAAFLCFRCSGIIL